MGSPPEAAVALKDQGNDAFRNQAWDKALAAYTQAIDAYDAEPSFYCNRAQTYIKLEQYGYAIQDADKAIALDPNNVKVRPLSRHAAAAAAAASPPTHRPARPTTAAPRPTPPS